MKILIAGDYYPDGMVKWDADIEKIIKSADYSIVNFESPIVEDNDKAIKKNGPNLHSSQESLTPIKNMGFSCLTLANNHTLDYGAEALQRTIMLAAKDGFDCVGASDNIKMAEKTLLKEINGKTVAVINCCEHEFSIASYDKPGTNPLDPINLFYIIKQANDHADHVIVIVHGGHEGYQLPSPRMQQTYRFLIDAGADVVVNHHQHCYSGYEEYKKGLIFYGLGNFFFPEDNPAEGRKWNEGFMLELLLENNKMTYQLHPYIQCRDNRNISLMKSSEKNAFYANIESLNNVINNERMLRNENAVWRKSTQRSYRACLSPFSNKLMTRLWLKNLLQSGIGKSRLVKLINFIECESHRDRFLDYLKSLLNDTQN